MAISPALLTQLPRELLGMIFDALDIQHIVRMSHVCTLCRLIAHAHPTFWRDVELDGVERCDLQLFKYRIWSSTKSGLRLDIDVFHVYADDSEAEPVRTVVLPTIRQHLFRTAYLRLDIRPEFAPCLFPVLCQPAACLETLILDMYNVPGAPVALPAFILAVECPKLRRVDLGDCSIPKGLIPAFERVENFRIDITDPRVLPENLFSQLPALKHLSIHSISGIGERERFYAVFRQAPPLLSLVLDIHGYMEHGNDVQSLFQRVPHLLSIPTIEFFRSHPVANLLTSHLPGPLGIELVSKSADVARYTVLSHSKGWRRTFAIHSDRDLGWPLPRFYAAEDMGFRVTTLALDASLARVAHLIGEMTACETLQLALDCALDVKPTQRLLLPALKRVVVRGTSPLYMAVSAATLGHFLGELVQMTGPIALQMDGVVLRGDLGCVDYYLLSATS